MGNKIRRLLDFNHFLSTYLITLMTHLILNLQPQPCLFLYNDANTITELSQWLKQRTEVKTCKFCIMNLEQVRYSAILPLVLQK